MNQFQIQRERVQLKSLHYWTTRAAMSGGLLFSIVAFPMTIVLPALWLIAIGFSVYILRALYLLKKNGWIITYAILIGIPFLVCLVPDESGLAMNALWFIPLALFFFYCWLLRYSITEWLSDLGDESAFELDKKYEKNIQGFMDSLQ
jgi:hypothetical protein